VDLTDDRAWWSARARHAVLAAAAALGRPGHVVSGRSAAILHGLPTFAGPDVPELTGPPDATPGRRDNRHVRTAGISTTDVTSWFGVELTTPARTLVDLGRHDRRDAIMAMDAAWREGLVAPTQVEAALGDALRWPGIRQAREIWSLASPLAESPLESLTRLVLHDSGFPPPHLQVRIRGTRLRVDLLWPIQRLVLEVDGLGKYTDAEARREKRRSQRLLALGLRVERITWDDIVRYWPQTRRWLSDALAGH